MIFRNGIQFFGKRGLSSDSVILGDTDDDGIKIDTDSPSYGWRDIIGTIAPDNTRAVRPVLRDFISGGGIELYAFAAGDQVYFTYHMPHDYVKGTDIYLHIHWAHNGTAISGTNNWQITTTYAKRSYPPTPFHAEKVLTLQTDSLNITDYPQYCHHVAEIQLSDDGGTGNRLDTNDLEVDGIILVALDQGTLPTISGGGTSEPFIIVCDIHYQSTNIGTKTSTPPYYSE
jgi:hypothetical protein